MKTAKALGIIFANAHDANIPEITNRRSMASVPFAGRYRMVDFTLSGMVNAGIENVGIIVRDNYQSLMDHLGNGREWDLSRKLGGLKIFPPTHQSKNKGDGGDRLEDLSEIVSYLSFRKEELVVMCDCEIAFAPNVKDIIKRHTQSGADITLAYNKAKLAPGLTKDNVVLDVSDEGFVNHIRINDYEGGVQNVSMNMYVMKKEFLLRTVKESMVHGLSSFEREFLLPNVNKLKIAAYEFEGYAARIFDLQSYFEESMRLIENNNIQSLFDLKNPVYTKVRDNAPVRYAIGSKVTNSVVADGCVIQGEVENCILFRDVFVKKGAKISNSVIMQGTVVDEGAHLKFVVTDKNVYIGKDKSLIGAKSFPVFINKGVQVE